MRKALLSLFAFACLLAAQQQNAPTPLTLAQAEQMALRNHPALAAARLSAEAANMQPAQVRAALLPILNGAVSSSVADHGSRIGAGQLNASSLFSRFGSGFNITQLLFDFGRTRSLAESARERAGAEQEGIRTRRAEIVLAVRQAYLSALLAGKTVDAMREVLETRRLLLRQVSRMAENNLKSTMDVGFAEVAVTEAELELDRATNAVRSANVELSAAMGMEQREGEWALEELTARTSVPGAAEELIAEAMRSRPDLAVLRRQVEAARRFADAERRLIFPSVSLAGAGGFVPAGDPRLRPRYGGLGLTMTLPLFNGNLNAARRDEAQFRSQAAEQMLRERELRAARDVKVAWIEAANAQRRVVATDRYREQAARVLRLAQSRYDLGLSSIVELNQAQTARLTADVQNAAARYEFELRLARLDFEAGRL